ncbi:MAG: prolyl aminopeptidase [Alphaproteobacteria bacterium]|nr:prolyl aminopeptidase [Alphaproteobacteria bacterium]
MINEILYPPIEPYRTGFLPVGDDHQLFWEECGNPEGVPILFLHGGPGYSCTEDHRRFFDPDHYRIILFDQRGAGKSTPHASIKNNQTKDLIDDIEKLRIFFKVDSWILFGGSWGSTLALCYGIDYPNRIKAFILRGVFLGEHDETEWFFTGMGKFNPEAGIDFMSFLPEKERDNYLENFYNRLKNTDPKIHLPAALAWHNYENRCVSLVPVSKIDKSSSDYLAPALIEAHYFYNDFFIKDAPILENLDQIKDIPTIIVHGRYDIVCPPITAYKLKQRMTNSKLIFADDSGHSAFEAGLAKELVIATNEFRSIR